MNRLFFEYILKKKNFLCLKACRKLLQQFFFFFLLILYYILFREENFSTHLKCFI